MNEPFDKRGIEHRLGTGRPVPHPGFRGELRRRLLEHARSGYGRPQGLRLLISAYAGSGAFLLALAAVGVLGGGPLAA